MDKLNLSKKELMDRRDSLTRACAVQFGQNLRKLRKGQGLTQERLGLMIGSKHPRISDMERGLVNVSFTDIAKLSRALEIEPAELIDLSAIHLEEYPPPSNN